MNSSRPLPNATLQGDLRPPETVMRLSRMGAFFPTRLSFMRVMVRNLAAQRVRVDRRVWDMNARGHGHAVYSLSLGGHAYSLVAFSTELEPDQRTDRVIAEAWDASFVLYDGVPDSAAIERLRANAPLQEAGRFEPTDLVLSRANKSMRLFEHVVSRLSRGKQPDEEMIAGIGYLMRTTAVYGNGKFGIADRDVLLDRPVLSGAFAAEMLTVWLIRAFTHDLVEHVAWSMNPGRAAPLDRRLKRHLGIGNSTGLGMAPFLVSHPVLINNWMMARETALARAGAVEILPAAIRARAKSLLARVSGHLREWNVEDRRQQARIEVLRDEWREVRARLDDRFLAGAHPWQKLLRISSDWSLECQELLVAFVLELHGDLVNGLSDCMTSDVEPKLEPAMLVRELRDICQRDFDWALAIDFDDPGACQHFWYVSEEKLEPRLGNRHEEAGAERELPLDIARQVQALYRDLDDVDPASTVAEFLLRRPQHRNAARRAQTLVRYPYAEIRDNLIGRDCLPIDMLRCKLSFFGASRFDPKSDRWTRISLYQGAPLCDELSGERILSDADDWWLPVLRENT